MNISGSTLSSKEKAVIGANLLAVASNLSDDTDAYSMLWGRVADMANSMVKTPPVASSPIVVPKATKKRPRVESESDSTPVRKSTRRRLPPRRLFSRSEPHSAVRKIGRYPEFSMPKADNAEVRKLEKNKNVDFVSAVQKLYSGAIKPSAVKMDVPESLWYSLRNGDCGEKGRKRGISFCARLLIAEHKTADKILGLLGLIDLSSGDGSSSKDDSSETS